MRLGYVVGMCEIDKNKCQISLENFEIELEFNEQKGQQSNKQNVQFYIFNKISAKKSNEQPSSGSAQEPFITTTNYRLFRLQQKP